MPSASQPQINSGPFGDFLTAPDTKGGSPPHFHATYAIGLNRSGGGTLFAHGRQWSYSGETVIVTNPFDPHWGRTAEGGISYNLLYPRPAWLWELPPLRGLAELPHFGRPVLRDRGLVARLKRAFEKLQRGDESLLAAAVGELFSGYAKLPPPGHARTRRQAPQSASPIAGMAAEAGLSRAYYSRRYRALTGLSPLDHRRQERVLAARSMIEAGADLAAAAADAGFADQAHMTRQFRQILGITPGTCRP